MSYYSAPVAVVVGPLILRYPPHQEIPAEVPAELRAFYPEDIWQKRMSAATKQASRYFKKGLEWVWLLITFGGLIAVPIAVYYVALNHLPDDTKTDDDKDDHHFFDFDRYWKARMISFATWIALMILFFVPMHLWKSGGKKSVNKMLAEFEAQDSAENPGQPRPTIRMKMPGVVSKNIKFVVTVPPPAPSYYQAGANVPAYLANGPTDPAAGNYYQQNGPTQPAMGNYYPGNGPAQPMPGPENNNYYAQNGPWGSGNSSQNASGELPMYNKEGQRLPGYDGAVGAYSDAKNPFEDVKV